MFVTDRYLMQVYRPNRMGRPARSFSGRTWKPPDCSASMSYSSRSDSSIGLHNLSWPNSSSLVWKCLARRLAALFGDPSTDRRKATPRPDERRYEGESSVASRYAALDWPSRASISEASSRRAPSLTSTSSDRPRRSSPTLCICSVGVRTISRCRQGAGANPPIPKQYAAAVGSRVRASTSSSSSS